MKYTWAGGGENDFTAATGTVAAVLQQIPNEPLAFAVDIPHDPRLYPKVRGRRRCSHLCTTLCIAR